MTPFGRWRLEREVGRGGAGVVWRAVDPSGQVVALKLLAPGARRFGREVRALSALRHPGLVSLLDSGEEAGRPFLVMEWVEGESLEARVERDGPLDPRVVSELGRRLALALEHCHARGVLHRDVKPGNVLLRAADGAPLLADFGLARDLEAPAGQTRVTREGLILGTPGFAPPEQLRGELVAVGPRADLYGLGATLHFALTGRAPVAGATLAELMVAAEREPAPPSRLRPGIPPELDRLVARCLGPDPATRPASAAEVARLLDHGSSRRRRVPWWAVAALGAVLAGATAWSGLRDEGSPADAVQVAALLSSARTRAAAYAPLAELLAITSRAELAAAGEAELLDQVALERADLLSRRGELTRALTALDPLLDRSGRTGLEARWQRARVLEGLARFAEAEEELARIEDADPEGALGLAAAAMVSQPDPRVRETCSTRALALEPANPHVLATFSQCAPDAGSMLDALAPLLSRRPDDPFTIELLAMAHATGGAYPADLRQRLERLVQAEPRFRLAMTELEIALLDRSPSPTRDDVLARFGSHPLLAARVAADGDPGPLRAAFAQDASRTLTCVLRLREDMGEALLDAAGWEPVLAPPIDSSDARLRRDAPPTVLRRSLARRARLAAPAARAALGDALLSAAGHAPWDRIAPLLAEARRVAPRDPVVALEAVRLLAGRERLVELDAALTAADALLADEADRRELELLSALHEMHRDPGAGIRRLRALNAIDDPSGRRAALEGANLLGQRRRCVELGSAHLLRDGDQPRLLAHLGRATSLELPGRGAALLERAVEVSGGLDLRVLGAHCVVLFGWLRSRGRSVQPALDLLAAHMRRHPHSPSLAADAAILGSLFPGEAGEWSRRELADVDGRVIRTAMLDRLLGSCELEVWGGSAEAVLSRWTRAFELDGEGPGPTPLERFRRRFGDRPELEALRSR